MVGYPFAAAREISLLGRTSTALLTSFFDAVGAAGAAQLVIAQRTARLMAAAYGLQPLDRAELGRMSDEKLEAARAAGPALIALCVASQIRLLRFWQREATRAAISATRFTAWNVTTMPQTMTADAVRAAARSRRAALNMAAAGAVAGAPVLAPYYDRIRANMERLSGPPAPIGGAPSAKGRGRRRARRKLS